MPTKKEIEKEADNIKKRIAEMKPEDLINKFFEPPACVGYPAPTEQIPIGASSDFLDSRIIEEHNAESDAKMKIKAPQDVIADLPQERITGDVLRGYGPRRGNLERLLRYWRPIMRKPGGFRRCRVILADHPELYPLENLCAWLHHETTGLWPNEGCHHPGMKNCRKKIRGVTDGSLITNDQFENRMRRLRRGSKTFEEPEIPQEMLNKAAEALKQFIMEEKMFCSFLRDDSNWTHEGLDEKGRWVPHGTE
jgi:hypothetical protein